MRSEEVRDEVLRQHRAIRDLAARVELAARPIAAGDRANLGPLRARCDKLHERVVLHIGWEDRHLRRALLQLGSDGRELALALERDHGEQLRVIDEIAGICRRDRLPAIAAGRVLEWTRDLCREMDQEETKLEDPRAFPSLAAPATAGAC